MNKGYIALHRKTLEWEWYDDPNTFRLFIHCLLKANHKDKCWRGINIKRGSFITSIDKLAKKLKLSTSKIRTAIKKLKLTNEITIKSQAQYSVVTVVNYDEYQTNRKESDKPIANESQTNDKPIATTNNDNNEKNDNKKNIYLRHVRLTLVEVEKLKVKFGDQYHEWIKRMDDGIEAKGYKYKSHYQALLNWHTRENKTTSSKLSQAGMRTMQNLMDVEL
jgi:biotin operon repressor